MFIKYFINFPLKNYTHNPNYNVSYLIRNAAVSDPFGNKNNSRKKNKTPTYMEEYWGNGVANLTCK